MKYSQPIYASAGVSLEFYEAGTLGSGKPRLVDVFHDEDAKIPYNQPIIADSNGSFPKIYLNCDVDVLMKDSSGKKLREDYALRHVKG